MAMAHCGETKADSDSTKVQSKEHRMDIPSDIACRIKTIFPASEHSQALALVSTATLHDGQLANPQCLRCAVQASKGSLQELVYYIDLLKLDFRDVIVAGEYQLIDARLTRVRDLTEPFTGI
jgi:hypothetical protein